MCSRAGVCGAFSIFAVCFLTWSPNKGVVVEAAGYLHVNGRRGVSGLSPGLELCADLSPRVSLVPGATVEEASVG